MGHGQWTDGEHDEERRDVTEIADEGSPCQAPESSVSA